MNSNHTRTLAGVTTTDEYAYVHLGGQYAPVIGTSTKDQPDDAWVEDFERERQRIIESGEQASPF